MHPQDEIGLLQTFGSDQGNFWQANFWVVQTFRQSLNHPDFPEAPHLGILTFDVITAFALSSKKQVVFAKIKLFRYKDAFHFISLSMDVKMWHN